MNSESRSPLIATILGDVLKDKSWKTTMPVLKHEDIIEFLPLYNSTITTDTPYQETNLEAIASEIIKNRWPSFEWPMYTPISYLGLGINLPWNYTLLQLKKWQRLLEEAVNNATDFPFPDVIPVDLSRLFNVRHGLRLMAYDLYQPMLLQHKTSPKTYREATVGIMKHCPTMLYDDPIAAFNYYPLDFIVCLPYFTMPRHMPWLDVDVKLALTDIFLPAHLGPVVRRNMGENEFDAIRSYLYHKDAEVLKLARTCYKRFLLVHGCGYGVKPPDNYAEFLLARDKAKKQVQNLGRNFYAMLNVQEASVEASRREVLDKELKIKQQINKLVDAAKAIHKEEFGV